MLDTWETQVLNCATLRWSHKDELFDLLLWSVWQFGVLPSICLTNKIKRALSMSTEESVQSQKRLSSRTAPLSTSLSREHHAAGLRESSPAATGESNLSSCLSFMSSTHQASLSGCGHLRWAIFLIFLLNANLLYYCFIYVCKVHWDTFDYALCVDLFMYLHEQHFMIHTGLLDRIQLFYL